MQTTTKPKTPWKVLKTFERDGYACRVKILELYHPRYSVEIGSMRGLPLEFRSFFDLQTRVENATVRCESIVDTIGRLVAEAECFVIETIQAHEDAEIDRKAAIEARRAAGPPNRGPQSKIPTREGKTARDRAKPASGQKTNDPTLSQKARGK